VKTITIDGVIGWDVSAADIRQQIRDAKGEDLTIEINSPGGMVTEGIAIFNAIKNAPGDKRTHITGLAASMGSYIALAAGRVTAEPNAIYMIHNAGMIAMGDHNQLRKAADIAEGMSKILATAYIGKTGKGADEIRAMMDAETFLYGAEIKDAGFADEIVGQAEAGDKAAAVLQTRAAVASADDLIKRLSTERDTEQAAAALADVLPKPREKAGVAGPAVEAKNTTGRGKKMTLEQIKAENPEIVQALRDEGVQAERKRVAGLSAWKGINADADKAVEEAVAAGKAYDDVAAQLAAAVAKGNGKQADGENAGSVASGTASNGANAAATEFAGLTAEDVAALRANGMTDDEIRANAPKGV
jgi:ATP-dependent protease ClpP protease subunit